MKKQTKYSPQEAEAKIKKYGRISNGLLTLPLLGILLLSLPQFLNNCEEPKIAKNYRTAQTALRVLKNERKELSRLLNPPYQNSEIKEIKEVSDREYFDKIKSVERDISEIETNSEFKQYSQREKTRKRKDLVFYFFGALAVLGGFLGKDYFNSKKTKLEKKYKK